MSAFKALIDVSNNFENDVRHASADLYSDRLGRKFEDTIAKKMKYLALFSSKLKLLNAEPLSATTQVQERTNEHTLEEYGDTAAQKVLEQVRTKTLNQTQAVQTLITTPDSNLDADLIERKKAIIQSLAQFRETECQLRYLNSLLKERETQYNSVRSEWDHIVGELRDTKDRMDRSELDCRGPLYEKLSRLVHQLEVMRWLIGKLVCARGPYDWFADPHNRLTALPVTRQHNTVDLFTQ